MMIRKVWGDFEVNQKVVTEYGIAQLKGSR
jgi:acyl-CoA hydrolase